MTEQDRQCTLYRMQMSSWCALDFKDCFSRRTSLYFPYSQGFVIQGDAELYLRVVDILFGFI